MREWIVKQLLRLVCLLDDCFMDDVLVHAALYCVTDTIRKRKREVLERMLAAYYLETSIPPEDAMIVIERNKNEWVLYIDPRNQDFEEVEVV
jgi:hypothetical protein